MNYCLTDNFRVATLFVVAAVVCAPSLMAQPSKAAKLQHFIHPGIDQRSGDLAYMKKKVFNGEQPWAAAFDRLKAAADTNFVVRVHTHVLRGPYGKPNIGGDDLSKCANMAYNYALVWYITRDKKYANKAIDILNAWSPVLWDLDYNDAKLLAGWTGHLLCNAAEIMRYTDAGWSQKDIDAFKNMLMSVYYPLMRPYYPQANGNWDGAIIHSLIAIAVFTDNRPLYENAIDHFKHGPVNGSIFKYIYPNGQCQESPRDQGHVQLGIGEFAGAAQVAYTQGTDLFSMADNRIALGFEYTARFLLGETPYCYCTISERAKVLRDDYEYVYRHYTAKGLDLPYTKRAADSVRAKASRSVLTAVRAPHATPTASSIAYIAGAAAATAPGAPTLTIPPNAILVSPGQSLQQALDSAASGSSSPRWVVAKAGLHTLPNTLKIPSNITLIGEGATTILFLDPNSGERETMINASPGLHDVTIRDLVIEASNKTDPGTDPNSSRASKGGYNRGGILFRAEREGQISRVNLIDLTIRNSTWSGLSISGGADLTIINCDLSENGASVPPGPKLTHNLLLAHCTGVTVSGSRLVTSPSGSGISLDHCADVSVTNCEIARNGYFGILLAESNNVLLKGNLIEANDRSGLMAEFLYAGNKNLTVISNRIQYNNGYGVESYGAMTSKIENNVYEGNGNSPLQQKISADRHITPFY
jgi:parallel beta-helix repeat protein